MCRWFAYISNSEKCLLEDVLILPDHGISKQVDSHYLPGLWPWETADTSDDNEAGLQNVYDRNFRNNSDGLGIAWYSSTRMEFTEPANIIPLPTLYKTLGHPSTDPNFISICATTATNALFAHIRAASPGLPVNEMNCHPFAFGRFTFMHNGSVGEFQGIKKGIVNRLADEAYAKIVGTTDSEHLAALLFTIISELSAQSGGPGGTAAWSASHPITRIVQAFEILLTTVLNLQRDFITKRKASGVSNAAPPTSSLNLCVTDGEQLVALRFHSHPVQQPPSLYWTNEAGVVLNRKFEGSPSSSVTTAANTNTNANVDATTKRLAANSGIDHTSASVDEVSYGTSGRAAEDHGPHLIIASEPTTEQQEDAAKWHVVPKNSYVLFGRETEEMVQIQRVELDWEKELGWAV